MRILVKLRWTSLLLSSFFITAAEAAPGDKIDLVRDLAGRVGPVIGSALACPDITRPRIQSVIEKFAAVIRMPPPTKPSAPTSRNCSIAASQTAAAR